MTAERWHRIKEIFEEVVTSSPAEEATRVTACCAGDEELEKEVQCILRHHRQAEGLLEGPLLPRIASAQPVVLAAGATLGGRFRIARLIGRGGMGEVYEAFDQSLGEDVALKTIHPRIRDDPEALRRFRQEIRLARKVQHPNVCRIHDLFSYPDEAGKAELSVVSMELVRGRTLQDYLCEHGPLPEAEAYKIVVQVAAALDAIHSAGIIHRDLKSSNVLLAGSETPLLRCVVTDFGLARKYGEPSATITYPGEIVGTPDYMSPEQLESGEATPRSDIYALGVVAYEIIAGTKPFPDGSALEAALSRIRHPPRPLRDSRPGVSERWERSVMRCLEYDPARRFGTAREFIDSLSPEALPGSGGRRVLTRRRVILSAAALAGAPLIGLVLPRLRRRHDNGPSILTASTVVLPFRVPGASPTPEAQVLAAGLTDELISSLTQVKGVRVIHQDSAFRFRNSNVEIAQIAKRLKVDTVVQGSVLQIGSRCRLTVELIAAHDQRYLWAHTYDANIGELVSIEADATNSIARQLQLEFKLAQIGVPEMPRQTDPATYALYLKGRFFWNQRSPTSLQSALECFQQAAARDPGYAPAYSGIADTYIALVDFGLLSPHEGFPKARTAAQQALSQDASLAEAHASLGQIAALFDWNWLEAERIFRHALDLNPGCGTARLWYATLLAREAQLARATTELTRALAADPLSLGLNIYMGWFQYYEREFAKAVEQAQRTLELDPEFLHPYHLLAESYAYLRRDRQALDACRTALRISNQAPLSLTILGTTSALLNRKVDAIGALDRLESMRNRRSVPFAYLAMICAALDWKDRAFGYLEQSVAARESAVLILKIYPGYDRLRSDPRYAVLLRRIGLPA